MVVKKRRRQVECDETEELNAEGSTRRGHQPPVSSFKPRQGFPGRQDSPEVDGPDPDGQGCPVWKCHSHAHEAVREVPYFACGDAERVFAPDVLAQLKEGFALGRRPSRFMEPDPGVFLVFLDEKADANVIRSAYDMLSQDKYFHGDIANFEELTAYRDFVRNNPLTRQVEDLLGPFFQAPISVGVRDTMRWALGSRHPELGWEKARETILACFARHRNESFIPVELNYYALDAGLGGPTLARDFANNELVVALFAVRLNEALKTRGFPGIDGPLLQRLAGQVLDFHHGYPLYDLEPYQGLLSISTVKMALRVVGNLALIFGNIKLPERRNRNLAWLENRPGDLLGLVATMDAKERERLLAAIDQALAGYVKSGGMRDDQRNLLTYQRIPRTFYSFQERAQYASSLKGKVEDTISLAELHLPRNYELLTGIPELAEKLTVFFTLLLRYYKDTGFIPDLRPKNAGRELLLLGIWGYVSENLLVVLWRDEQGERHADLSFVDNKDQFKEYRRMEDRDAPKGLAKHALRMTGSLAEPAMLRAIGMFTEIAAANFDGRESKHQSVLEKYSTKGVDIAHEVVHTAIDQLFDNAKTAVEDLADDVFTGVRKWLKL